ncbi:tRNA1(Val) (adenine(37)-N6)-methyltransferase [Aliagarivorans marinus]|uniref:tRNA1(Val) (adenine(37)-N6)-methyltransferase n=1 Tax=Aliagarivorans marinus TaxID=561965 RepID=UPI0004285E4A|nr:methyltransferase [Aliagarivorans marinus]
MTKHSTRKGFTFKQFHVAHDRCAMKVGTDGVLLGAWAQPGDAKRILDVGCGSGLVALMLAQRSGPNVHIDALDIEADACQQARENVAHSPWPNRVAVYHCALQHHKVVEGYDLVVSNPPYFPAGQQFDAKRMLARHSNQLSAASFFDSLGALTHKGSRVCLVLPSDVAQLWLTQAQQHGWWLGLRFDVVTKAGKPATRSLLELVALPVEQALVQTLLVHDDDGAYSEQFRNLTKDYYLNF